MLYLLSNNNITKMSRQDMGVTVENQSFRSRSRIASKHGSNRYEESSINSEQNQFLKAYVGGSPGNMDSKEYRTLNASKMTEGEGSPKQRSHIEKLQDSNNMLRKEVQRVDRILSMGKDKPDTNRLPQINVKVIQNELKNAYHQIKFYQGDISKRQKLFQHEGTYVDMIRKAQRTLMERLEMVKKLNAEIIEVKKISGEYTKQLQDGNIGQIYASKVSKLHKEIKYYQLMLKEEEDRAQAAINNNQKKRASILMMEEELQKGGFSKMEINNMRRKYQSDRTNQTSMTVRVEQGQDRSKKAFDGLRGEMNMLKKMQKDYAKKIDILQKERTDAGEKSNLSKERLQQLQKELQEVENRFMDMKRNIDPTKLKPTFKQAATMNQSSISQFGGKSQGNPLQHRFQTLEAGEVSKKGQIVNDRVVIGKKSAKIVQITMYENRTQFLGFQATYLMGDGQKKGGLNLLKRQNERFLTHKSLKLENGDYFISFQIIFSKQNVIVGVTAVSGKGKGLKGGSQQGFKKQLLTKGKEYPCCLFGSFSERGFEYFGTQKVQSQ